MMGKLGLVLLIFAVARVACGGMKDAVMPPNIGDVRILGRPGELMSKSVYARAFSDHARTTVYDEAEKAFETHWDTRVGNGRNPGWQNEYWGKTMLCYAGVIASTGDRELKAWALGKAHAFVSKYQKPNGYLSTYEDENLIGLRPDGPLKDGVWNFNYWGQKYTMWALVDLYRVTGDRFCLEAAERMADFIIAQLKCLGKGIDRTGSWQGLSSMTLLKPILLLYRETGKNAYLDLARQIVKVNDTPSRHPSEMNLIHNALTDVPVCEWFGSLPYYLAKGYELMSFFEGVAEYCRVTGDERAFSALRAFHRHLVEEESNAIGAVGHFDHFVRARGRRNGMSELCDVTHWIRLNRELWLLTGESQYLDCIEQAFYNAFLAGVSHDGSWGAHIIRSHGSRHVAAPPQTGMKFHQCCPDNMLRTFFDWSGTVAGVTRDGAVAVNLYSDSEVALPGARVSVSGGYPIADRVRVTVVLDKSGKVRFRVPSWSRIFALNGLNMLSSEGWVEIDAPAGETTWMVSFDMSPRIVDSAEPVPAKVVGYNAGYTKNFMEWYTPEMKGLVRDAPAARVLRGPLILAKGRLAGTSFKDTLAFQTIDRRGWKAAITPTVRTAGNAAVWGAWTLELSHGDECRTYLVADFWSVSNVDDPENWFSVWF